ncbi:MAG: hypothetical protein Q27BB25_00365 [Blastomonas sp. CACIA14H2]|nr:MAG: hypothetical protein Q27BB25_00365 [Blastomonas sp. CACIA14H2]
MVLGHEFGRRFFKSGGQRQVLDGLRDTRLFGQQRVISVISFSPFRRERFRGDCLSIDDPAGKEAQIICQMRLAEQLDNTFAGLA